MSNNCSLADSLNVAMEVALFCIIFFVATIEAAPTRDFKFKDSYLEQTMLEDVIPDLAGRGRLILRDLDTDDHTVLWVKLDRESRLPYVQDPITNLPYLLVNKAQDDEPEVFRMMRGRDHRFVVTTPDTKELYRPFINRLGEVDLVEITEKEAGFTRKDASVL